MAHPKWVSGKDLAGKTIAKVGEPVYSHMVCLIFTDGTFTGWSAEEEDDDDDDDTYIVDSEITDQYVLKCLGLITEDEYRAYAEQKAAATAAYRREQYERLKKEFEPS